MAIIVDFPIKNGDFPISFLYVYQRVILAILANFKYGFLRWTPDTKSLLNMCRGLLKPLSERCQACQACVLQVIQYHIVVYPQKSPY